jgi:membrane protease YdiL (CAAX protease family)
MTGSKDISNSRFLLILLMGTVMFVPLFIFRTLGSFDFWWWMSSNLVILIFLSLLLDQKYLSILKEDFRSETLKKIILGVFSAAILYGVFWVGNFLSRQWFGFAEAGIEGVYNFKGDAAYIRILLLMSLIIGPGEEIFWRGAVQRWSSSRLGGFKGFLAATLLYTGVHIFSFNIMLIVAAFTAGVFWGLMYFKFRSVFANILSHTLWDISVFLVFPFT